MKNMAKLDILNYITSFCLSVNYGDGINRGGFGDSYFTPTDTPKIGDLVILKSGRFTEWYLSWYVGYEQSNNGKFCDIHTLESIDTGKLCNWSNVSFNVLNKDVVDKKPRWKWTDKQFLFEKRWFNSCYEQRGAYINLPIPPKFKENGSVILSTRKRYSRSDGTRGKSKVFKNWKKVLVKDMLEFYDSVNKGE